MHVVTFPIIEGLGLRPVINAVGSPTRLGGTRYSEPVVQAMLEASQCFVPIHELQARASEAIVALTGAEAGCVTTGAAASLYLGACAILAGDELASMHELPDTQGRPSEFVVHRPHRSPYDHAVRAAGGKLVEFGYAWQGVGAYPWQLEAAIGPNTAGILFQANAEHLGLPLATVSEIAHAAGLPVLVDAAEELPPADRLRRLIADGADLIAVSGGKALHGPAGSGFLAGRRELVLSAAMQHQDMYTTPELFPGPFGEREAGFTDPGHHGMGRILKVGREQIIGLTVAIETFLTVDPEAELARCRRALQTIQRHLATRVAVTIAEPTPGALPYMRIELDDSSTAFAVARTLLEEEPRIFVDEGQLKAGVVGIGPRNLTEPEAEIVGRRLAVALRATAGGAL
ncbi:MAG TPA: aminotransferase class V-fold PLP-dependent enzyme [Solirubrobacter sp.]|nr:aminotransferase class V-fold PLP-dependent enzyme [Solirubrobacter sp.]